jgi:hypothetical protein
VGEVPAVRASVGCGCVEFCLVWTAPLVAEYTCRISVEKHEGKTPLGNYRHRCKDIIIMALKTCSG